MGFTCYLLLAICYSLSDTCYLKLATSCKNLIPFAPVVRLALVIMSELTDSLLRPRRLELLPWSTFSIISELEEQTVLSEQCFHHSSICIIIPNIDTDIIESYTGRNKYYLGWNPLDFQFKNSWTVMKINKHTRIFVCLHKYQRLNHGFIDSDYFIHCIRKQSNFLVVKTPTKPQLNLTST